MRCSWTHDESRKGWKASSLKRLPFEVPGQVKTYRAPVANRIAFRLLAAELASSA